LNYWRQECSEGAGPSLFFFPADRSTICAGYYNSRNPYGKIYKVGVRGLKSKKPTVKIISLITALLLFGMFVYFSKTTLTAQSVILEKTGVNAIVVADYSGVRTTVKTAVNISELVQEGEQYYITYKTKMWGAPELLSIKKTDAR